MSFRTLLQRSMTGRVLVIGSGLTGSLSASIIHDNFPEVNHVSVWDKSHGAGGRMSTSRNGPNAATASTADLGAQYISANPTEYQTHNKFYKELEGNGLLKHLEGLQIQGQVDKDEGMRHFVTPNGISSLVKHYLHKSGAETCYGRQVTDIKQEGEKWIVSPASGPSEEFDCVIMTMPIPQILNMEGQVKDLLNSQNNIKENLQKVRYSSRFAVGLFYEAGTELNFPWSATYVKDDVVRFVSIDNKKRGIDNPSEGPSVVIHTSVPFGIKHLEEDKEDVCKNIVMPRLFELFPDFPEPKMIKSHKWRYSQVSEPYDQSPGAIVLQDRPLLICAGDGFSGSGFNACINSALKVVDILNTRKDGKLLSKT